MGGGVSELVDRKASGTKFLSLSGRLLHTVDLHRLPVLGDPPVELARYPAGIDRLDGSAASSRRVKVIHRSRGADLEAVNPAGLSERLDHPGQERPRDQDHDDRGEQDR